MSKAGSLTLHIVTGFLGAGKTTLLNRWLRAPELADALVIVNEFGSVGLDHELVEAATGDVVLMPSGCLCCDLRGDLVESLRGLLQRRAAGELPPFRRIVLETSGLADPAPILHAWLADPLLSREIGLAGIVTLVDAVNGAQTLEHYGEARRQVALADSLVVTKADLSQAGIGLTALLETLSRLNPAAPVYVEATTAIPVAALLAAGPLGSLAPRARAWAAHSGAPAAQAFTSAEPSDEAAVERFLAALRRHLGPELLRVKGLIALRDDPGRPLVVQGAQHVLHPLRRLAHWPGEDRRTRLVIITDGAAANRAQDLWRALAGAPQIDRPDLVALTDNPLAPARGGLLG